MREGKTERMDILQEIQKRICFFDGGMGSLLQAAGLKPGELPGIWNITHPEELVKIHRAYLDAGADIMTTNTFGVDALKYNENTEYRLDPVITSAVRNAKKAVELSGRDACVALDMGPTGKLLKPLGDLAFEDAYELYSQVVRIGAREGVDLVIIETMSDSYETKAAVLAAKENCDLPVFVTVTFDEKGKLLTGGTPASIVAMLEGLGVDAIGMNCGLGPIQMKEILKDMLAVTSVPVIVNPNAGLPRSENGETVYDINAEQFADALSEIVDMGARVVGGCCGTTPDHIRRVVGLCKDKVPVPVVKKHRSVISSFCKAVEIGKSPVLIGERINPTGKSKFKQALRDHNLEYILREGVTQQDHGAHVLDVNVGLPEIDEKAMLVEVVRELQSIVELPLQMDTTNIEAMEAALRVYNGKALINSVNGKQVSMDEVFPLIRKYGGVVVGLTIDEEGIPKDAEGRVRVAGKIINEAAKYGIDKKDIVIDVLTMTISSEKDGAKVTLEALKRVREEFGVRTVLGVSNISFGLPRRPIVNSYFYAMAMQNGLTAGIINPSSEDMMKAYRSYNALMGFDENCTNYISTYAGTTETVTVQASQAAAAAGNAPKAAGVEMTLKYAIERGLKEEAHHITRDLIGTREPLDIIQEELIPALNVVGEGFEKGTVFLPQLLMSADAAKIAFAVIKDVLASSGQEEEKKEKIILATVKGDIHDIGKNIVKVLLENYGFDVIDLGKDVPPEAIVEKAVEENVTLVGLSALMTTTVVSMEETIKLLREKKPDCKVMVGGAVLNQDYADMIGADFYGKDAMQSVHYAQKFFGMVE